MLRTLASSLVLIALSAISLPAQEMASADAANEAAHELAAAQEAILHGLSKRDRDYALAIAKLNGPPILNLRGMNLLRGQIGLLGERLDEQSDLRRPWADDDPRLVVGRIIDDDEILIADQQLWLEGVDAANVVDGRLPQLGSVVFQVRGTRRYTSPTGTMQSVWHLKALDLATALDAADKIRALKEFRMWRSDSGEFLRPGKFLSFKRGRVMLEYLDGKNDSLPLPRLSEADQDYVRQLVKGAKAE